MADRACHVFGSTTQVGLTQALGGHVRVAACAVILRKDRVLLGRRSSDRSYYPGSWDLFGGHVEFNEDPTSALTRELSEELGIVPVGAEAALVVPEPRVEANGLGQFHVFLVTDWIGEPYLKNAEHDHIGWFTLAEVATLDLADEGILDVLGHFLRELPT